jgi:hypothetical protein
VAEEKSGEMNSPLQGELAALQVAGVTKESKARWRDELAATKAGKGGFCIVVWFWA